MQESNSLNLTREPSSHLDHEGGKKASTQRSSTCAGKPDNMSEGDITNSVKDLHTQRKCIIIVRVVPRIADFQGTLQRTNVTGGGGQQTLITVGADTASTPCDEGEHENSAHHKFPYYGYNAKTTPPIPYQG